VQFKYNSDEINFRLIRGKIKKGGIGTNKHPPLRYYFKDTFSFICLFTKILNIIYTYSLTVPSYYQQYYNNIMFIVYGISLFKATII